MLLRLIALAAAAAGAAALDVSTLDSCKPVVDEFCADARNKYTCLMGSKTEVSTQCWTELVDLTISETLATVSASCPDACPECTQESTECVEKCIVGILDPENTDKAKKEELPRKCQNALSLYQRRSAENVRADLGIWLYCKDERAECMQQGLRGTQFRKCVEDKALPASKCKEAVFAREEADAESIDFAPALRKACQAEIEGFCGDTDASQPGAVKHCLFARRKRPRFGADCRAAIEKATEKEESDIRLDYKAFKMCRGDVLRLCQGKGDKLTCLKQRFSAVSARCKPELKRIIATHADAAHTDKPLMAACKDDVLRYCGKVPAESNKLQACLRKHGDSDEEPLAAACAAVLFKDEKVEAESVELQGGRFDACKTAVDTLCEGVEPGEQNILDCLVDKRGDERMPASCRDKVREWMEEQGSDVSLYKRLAKRCIGELPTLCGPASHFFTTTHPEAAQFAFDADADLPSRGWVLKCLVESSTKIQSEQCKASVVRLERQHAEDYATDHVFAKACRRDVQTHCTNIERGQGRVHECLRKHYKDLSPVCQRAEFEEEVTEAADIRLKPALRRACGSAIAKFCKDVEQGDARVIRCLEDHKADADMPRACRAAIVREEKEKAELEQETAATGTAEEQAEVLKLRPGMKRACSALLKPGAACAGSRDPVGCLVALVEADGDAGIKDQGCKKEVLRLKAQQAEDVRTDAEELAVCEAEIERYCKDTEPGQGRVHECLRQHFNDYSGFSDACRVKELSNMKLAVTDVRLNPKLMSACKRDMKTVCEGVDPGDAAMLRCLQDNVAADDKLAPKCRSAVRAQMVKTAGDISLHYRLRTACRGAGARLAACQGKQGPDMLECLLANVRKLPEGDCRSEVERVGLQRSENIEVDPEAMARCRDDIARFCSAQKGKGKGQVHACLREQSKLGLLSEACRQEEAKVEELEATDVRMNFPVKSACKRETKLFCADVPVGDARVIGCLVDHLDEEQMSRKCQARLNDFATLELMNPSLNHRLTEQCADELKRLCGSARPNQYMSCLVAEFKKTEASKCHLELMRTVRVQALSFEASNEMLRDACAADRQALCAGVTPGSGRLHKCLRKKIGSGLSQACADQETGLMMNEATDYRINPTVQRACMADRRRVCAGEVPGRSRVLSCLKAHSKDADFAPECAQALAVFPNKAIPPYKPSASAGVSGAAAAAAAAGGSGSAAADDSFIQLNGWVALAAITALVASVVVVAQRAYARYQTTSKGYTVVINKD